MVRLYNSVPNRGVSEISVTQILDLTYARNRIDSCQSPYKKNATNGYSASNTNQRLGMKLNSNWTKYLLMPREATP
jgi:hypothetical protein